MGKKSNNLHIKKKKKKLQHFAVEPRRFKEDPDSKEYGLIADLSIVRISKDNIYLNTDKVKFRDLIVNHIKS